MAQTNKNVLTRKISGSVGKQLVFREWQGKTIVAQAPGPRTGDPTPQQLNAQEKFFLASRYAKSVVNNADQTMAEAYAAALRPRQNVYSRALEDFLSPPVVKFIDTRNYFGAEGETIVVRAFDDFHLTGVRIEIRGSNGSVVETGLAVRQSNTLDWLYTATAGNTMYVGSTIRAIATDVPGNEGMLEVTVG